MESNEYPDGYIPESERSESELTPMGKEKPVEEIKYPCKEQYMRNEHTYASRCYTCGARVKTFYSLRKIPDAPRQTLYLCTACYEKHVVKSELAPMKKIEGEWVEPVVYPGPEMYEKREYPNEYPHKYLCLTCGAPSEVLYDYIDHPRRGGPEIHTPTRSLCPVCYEKHVLAPAKKTDEIVEKFLPLLDELAPMKKVEPVKQIGREYYKPIDDAFQVISCLCGNIATHRIANFNKAQRDFPLAPRYICNTCYNKIRKVEPVKQEIEYPTSDKYHMEELAAGRKIFTCQTCCEYTTHVHVFNFTPLFETMKNFPARTLILCPSCFTKHVRDPKPEKFELYDWNCGLTWAEWMDAK